MGRDAELQAHRCSDDASQQEADLPAQTSPLHALSQDKTTAGTTCWFYFHYYILIGRMVAFIIDIIGFARFFDNLFAKFC